MLGMRAVRDPRMPTLAWLAHVDDSLVTVRHGAGVETGPRFVVEGVWPGSFEQAGFDCADAFFGSGIVLRNEQVLFVPSIGLTDPLYHSERPEGLFVSNSLPLLLAAIDDRLDPGCLDYHKINGSMTEGLDGYRRDLPTSAAA